MTKEINFNRWLVAGLITEAALLVYSYFSFPEPGEVFRHAARYSGRFSLFIYLFAFYYFAATYNRQASTVSDNLKKIVTLFCIMHFIHFGFLSLNIYLNGIKLIPYKLAGGFLAYLMILVYPFIIHKLKTKKIIHLVYFYYVGFVMAVTYVSRIKGDFDGAAPGLFHYAGFIAVIAAFVVFTILIIRKRKLISG